MRFVKLDKEYLGVAETRISAESTLPWICAYLEIESDGEIDGHGGEAVILGGLVVGSISSIVYSHTVEKILAFAYIKPTAAQPGTMLEVIVNGEIRSGRVLSEPVYDPQSILPRADA